MNLCNIILLSFISVIVTVECGSAPDLFISVGSLTGTGSGLQQAGMYTCLFHCLETETCEGFSTKTEHGITTCVSGTLPDKLPSGNWDVYRKQCMYRYN